jgi:hypothetical protein
MTTPTLTPRQVTKTVEGEQTAGTLPVLPLIFTTVNDYTTYAAEFAITEGDLVFHFYATDEVNQRRDPRGYWLEAFPAVMERVAKDYFKADFPRLKAAYTEEKASWWMRAKGFGQVLDPHKFTYKFLDELDSALDLDGAANSSK